MADIGYNDGIKGFLNWLNSYSVWQEQFAAWCALPDTQRLTASVPVPPRIPRRGPRYDPNNKSTWPWPELLCENTLRKLKDDHDAANNPTQPTDPTDPTDPVPTDPAASGYAPQSYNQGSRGQNARYNVRINCTQRSDGNYVDKRGIVYDGSGLQKGGRSERPVPGLKPADMMDGKEPWDPYEWMGKTYPPYPAESYEQ